MGKADVRARLKTFAVWRYGPPVVSVAAALAASYLLQPYDFRTPLLFLAIMVSTWAGGTRPGLLAVLLSTLFTGQFLSPQGILETRFQNVPNVVALLLTSLMAGSWYAARRRAEEALRESDDAWAGTLAPEDFERIIADVRAALRARGFLIRRVNHAGGTS